MCDVEDIQYEEDMGPATPSMAIEPVVEGGVIEIQPMDVDAMVSTYKRMRSFIQKVMDKDTDFGEIPGTNKPTLYKPGAEKLQRFFGFSTTTTLSHADEKWEVPVTATSFPLFQYRYTTTVFAPNGKVLATCDGLCSSYESKYRWRWVPASYVPKKYNLDELESRPGVEREPAFAISKKATTGQYGKPIEYWQSWEEDIANERAYRVTMRKRDGGTMDAWERDSSVYRVPNEDIHSQINTIMKMSQKRSYVGAIIIAANASEFFTQDLEDYSENEQPMKNEPQKPKDIHDAVPNRTLLAQALVSYVEEHGIEDAANQIKVWLDEEKIVFSLDNWTMIMSVVDKHIQE